MFKGSSRISPIKGRGPRIGVWPRSDCTPNGSLRPHSLLVLKAPAKINWFLRVCGLRSDGYHEIESLIQKISLYDILVFTPSNDLTVITNLRIPIKQNLVYKAAVLLREKCGINAGAKIDLNKKIPVAAGLGGGSSDAASTLMGLNKIWSLGLSGDVLYGLAEQLGSDVPFFLNGPLAFVRGRGEKITNFRADKPFNILLVRPAISVSTRWSYENLFTLNNGLKRTLTKRAGNVDNIKPFIQAIGQAELYRDSSVLNDLESVACRSFPVIADIKKKLLGAGALFSMMSGSGPTLFGVFDSAEGAKNASNVFKDYWTAVIQTITD